MSPFHTENKLRVIWDIIIFFCILFAAVESPLRIVLFYDKGLALSGIYVLVDILFFGDIFVNVFSPESAQIRGKRLPFGRERTARYLRSWFLFDLVAALPFELVAQKLFGIELTFHPYLFLVFGLTRTVKVVRIPGIIERLNLAFQPSPGVLRLGLLGFWITIVAHWFAIGWLYMDQLDRIKTGWHEYTKALYWSVMTLATVGYGDVLPTTTEQRIYSILVMMIGAAVYATIIGNVASILGNLDLERSARIKKMSQVDSFLKARDLPSELRLKIRDYYIYMIEKGFGENEKELLSDLPISLQREVRIHLHRELLTKVPFLKGAEVPLISALVFSLKHQIFLPGDIIFRKGDIGHNLYILGEGRVEILSEEGKTIATASEGQFFGELALVTEEKRSATVRSMGITQAYTLSKDDFLNALNSYPAFREAIFESVQHLRPKLKTKKARKNKDSSKSNGAAKKTRNVRKNRYDK
ncbi:cyclic nucleotide-binding protein [Leptospira gomenensis]|uniref:Cyclic nucleotide-binding protein n=1 Tax=Leptospira gomenensis TaxID=2484974 RepID=A0A5F1YBS7_9LEPT|nr:cyclic nucleotide-binding domain-containing protein [Leptospira gomenensis]TGK34588.1 cyclic nucleotide-binding protein [Leptospira gomenensis]TGK40488.1 cyclic nucleotide-binding protein [Leptospira gomenensis]TGK55611.1 cyclic nucleotide-binding protein [Leptospira gomenensis]